MIISLALTLFFQTSIINFSILKSELERKIGLNKLY